MQAFLLPIVVTATLALGVSTGVQADDPPGKPAGVVARAYNPTSGGIAWLRSTDDAGAVTGYEVVRDGVVLGVRDALSHVDRELLPGTTYTYVITAIDIAGQRSDSARVQLVTPDARPLTPQGLRANIYSDTALGLIWERPAAIGVRYEIRRDGRHVATTDGTTHVAQDLIPGRGYLFEVIAVNRQGQRSPSARLSVRTNSATVPASSRPPAPMGLRVVPYSGTAAGLIWTRPTVIGLRHEVSRDGVVLASSDAITYVDDSLTPGSDYRFTVVAIDREGRRSAPAHVSLRTPGIAPLVDPAPDAAVLNHDNADAVVARVLAVYAGKGFDAAVGRAYYIDESDEPISIETIDPEMGVTKSVYLCDNGGRAVVTGASYSGTAFTSEQYENCEWNGRVHQGDVDYSLQLYGRHAWTYDLLSVTGPEGDSTSVKGDVERSYTMCKIDSFDRWMAQIERYESSTVDGTTVLEDVNTEFGYGDECQQLTSRLGGSFELRSPLAEGRLLQIDTPVGFVNLDSDSRDFPTGRLEIRAEDGSMLALDTDDADDNPATVALVLTIDGETETQSRRWDTWQKILSFEDD